MTEGKQLTDVSGGLYFGDNLPDEISGKPGEGQCRATLALVPCRQNAVNDCSGDVRQACLPEIGHAGKMLFPFSGLNILLTADRASDGLAEKNLYVA